MVDLSPESQRKRALRHTRYQCVFQTLLSFCLLVCGGLLVNYRVDKVLSVVYYSITFALAGLVLFSCLLSFRVVNNGPSFDATPEARSDVLCGINWKQTSIVFLVLVGVATLVIIILVGFCLDVEEQCTFREEDSTNRSISIVTFILTILAFITAAYDIYLIRLLKPAFEARNESASSRFPPGSRGGIVGSTDRTTGANPADQLQQQNQILQQHLQQQQQQQSQFYPFTPPTSSSGHCYTNMAFTLPDLPPYSLTPPEVGSSGNTNSAPFQTQSSSLIFPSEPPPPYSEVAEHKPS